MGMNAGWFWVLGKAKRHFYVDGRSLCGKSSIEGRVTFEAVKSSSDCCKNCFRMASSF